ncbi:MAG: POTRA domain-containing protein, partial [Deltaproteobacteria bacterium]
MKIYLKTIPGPQFFFEFEGNTEFSEHELLSPLRAFEAAAPRVTVDDILKHIVLLYKQQGFYHVQASYQSYLDAGRNRRLIHFKLDTFEPVTIAKILIQGNRHFDEAFYLDFIHENGPELLLKSRFYENDFEIVSRLLTDHLKTKGFLFPKVSLRSLNWTSKKTSVSPELQIEEGPQTRISEIQISGNQFFSHSDILNRMQLPLDTPLNLFQLELGLKNLADLYSEHGFLKFVIKNSGSEQMIRYSKDFTSAILKLDLQEGPQTKIGNLIFRGALRTRNRVIERELFFKKGDIWNPKNIQKSENQLLRLGLFSSVKMTPIGG